MVKPKRLKLPYLWFQSVFNSSACNCCGGAVCIMGKTHEAPRQAFRLLVYSLSCFFFFSRFLFSFLTFFFFFIFFKKVTESRKSQNDCNRHQKYLFI